MSSNYIEDGSLSEKWKYRFSFYDRYGFPGFWSVKPEYKKAIKELTFRQKATIGMNFYAFFFSFIYLFILGLWKKAILVFFLLLPCKSLPQLLVIISLALLFPYTLHSELTNGFMKKR